MTVEKQLLNIDIGGEDIAGARRAMSSNFPRDADCQRG